jgi:MFS family permease
LLPLFFAAAGLDLGRISVLTATYPAVWGVSQLATGALSDRWGRKWMIVGGMWLQAGAIWMIVWAPGFGTWLAGAVVLGLGTGLVYPTLIAAVSDVARPAWRATSVGVYRLWRDLGFAIGAIVVGTVADRAGVSLAIILVGVLTALSGIIVALLMIERPPTIHPGQATRRA